MKQKEILVDNKKIAYHESKENGLPVAFIHGMFSSSSIFIRQLIDSSLSYKYRLIMLDLPGHGNSDISDNPLEEYSLKGLSKYIVEFSNGLGLKNAVYIGHNIGGNVAIEAFNGFNNPKGLVLLACLPFSNLFSTLMFLKKEMFGVFSKPELNEIDIQKLTRWFVDYKTSCPDFITNLIKTTDKKTRQYFFESVQNGIFTDQNTILEKIDIPVALFLGEYDQIVNRKYLESINISASWGNNIQIIKNAGHIFFYENPADFNVNLETYLDTVFKE